MAFQEKVTDPLPKSSQGANRTNGPPYAAESMMSMDSDDGIPSNGQSMQLPFIDSPTEKESSKYGFTWKLSFYLRVVLP